MKQFTKQQIEEAVFRIVAERGGVAAEDLTRATHFRDDLNYDSLDMVETAMSVEEMFNISIPDDDVEGLQTVSDVIDYVVRRTHAAEAAA